MSATIREFVESRLDAGDTPMQAWRAAQDFFTGGWQVCGWNYVQKIARDYKCKKEEAANAANHT